MEKLDKLTQKECPKCPKGQGFMNGETQEIPMGTPRPFALNPMINLEQYTPKNLHNYKYYAFFKCRMCGFVEFFLYNIKN
jgi:hypothetical protein